MKKTLYITLLLAITVVIFPQIGLTYEELKTPQAVLDIVRKHPNKVVVLNFFASYCSVCKKEVPILSKVQKDYGTKMMLYGIALDDTTVAIDKFKKETGLDYPVYTIPYNVGMAFELSAIPQIFIYNKKGVLQHRILGLISYKELQELLLPLL